jgi:BarA-like signal transduction histidine kinase
MAGTAVARAHATLLALPVRSRLVVETLRQIGSVNLAALSQATNLPRDELFQELGDLRQQGMVIVLPREDDDLYRATL